MSTFSSSIFQATRQTDRLSTRVTALVQIENAARWMGRDIPQAQGTDLVNGAPPVSSMSITWTDTSNYNTYDKATISYHGSRISYNYDPVNRLLRRSYSTCSGNDPSTGAPYWNPDTGVCSTTWVTGSDVIIARYIVTSLFSLGNNLISITLAAQPKGGPGVEEQRSYLTSVALSSTAGSPVQ